MTKSETSEKAETAEQQKMADEVAESDKNEDKAWRTKSDATSFGRKRIDIPERW